MYIKLEDVRNLYDKWNNNPWYWVWDLIDSIEALPTINPVEVLEQMIEKIESLKDITDKKIIDTATWALQIAREKIKS